MQLEIVSCKKNSILCRREKDSPAVCFTQLHKHVLPVCCLQGDTLYQISKKFQLTVDDILKVNNIKDPNHINPGKVIK